ncbi:MAG: phytanoyl-CoA dioxygenase family protein [Geminicoccaceae bacterium]
MLSDAQKKQFERDGFLVVENVIAPDLLSKIRAEYEDLLAGLVREWQVAGRISALDGLDFWGQLDACYRAGLDWFQPMDISLPGSVIEADTPFHFGPAVFDLVTHEPILDVVEDVIGPEITSNPIQHIRIKPPAATLKPDEVRAHVGGTDWHQDRAVAHAEADATTMVTVWVAITDATIERGCLQAVPGKPKVYPHCPQRQTAIAAGFLDESRAQPLPVGAGGIVLLHPLTPHSSLDNRSERFRWSFDLRYNVTGEPTGRAHFPAFVARSARSPETVLTDWRAWKAMWEQARARLAGEAHIPIHRWRADSPVCA